MLETWSLHGSEVAEFVGDRKLRNRPYRERVAMHAVKMMEGRWTDERGPQPLMLSDTLVIGGETRVCACSLVDWTLAPRDPVFVAITGMEWDEGSVVPLVSQVTVAPWTPKPYVPDPDRPAPEGGTWKDFQDAVDDMLENGVDKDLVRPKGSDWEEYPRSGLVFASVEAERLRKARA